MRLEGCKRNLLQAMRYGRLNGTLITPIRQIIADFYFTHCPLLKFCFFAFLHRVKSMGVSLYTLLRVVLKIMSS